MSEDIEIYSAKITRQQHPASARKPLRALFRSFIHSFIRLSIYPSSTYHLSIHFLILSFSLLSIIHPTNFSITHSSIDPLIHPLIHPSTHPSTHPSIHSSIHSSIHTSIHSSIHSSIHPLIYPPTLPSTHPSIQSSIHSSIEPLIYP